MDTRDTHDLDEGRLAFGVTRCLIAGLCPPRTGLRWARTGCPRDTPTFPLRSSSLDMKCQEMAGPSVTEWVTEPAHTEADTTPDTCCFSLVCH